MDEVAEQSLSSAMMPLELPVKPANTHTHTHKLTSILTSATLDIAGWLWAVTRRPWDVTDPDASYPTPDTWPQDISTQNCTFTTYAHFSASSEKYNMAGNCQILTFPALITKRFTSESKTTKGLHLCKPNEHGTMSTSPERPDQPIWEAHLSSHLSMVTLRCGNVSHCHCVLSQCSRLVGADYRCTAWCTKREKCLPMSFCTNINTTTGDRE